MTSRERMLTAMRNGIPDRVPVAPDISTYIPMKMSGLTAQDFWMGSKGMPHWQAYLNAADHFGIDAWTGPAFWVPTVNEPVKAEWKTSSELDVRRGGGFVLSTGDQCGRDTPDENIFAMVEVAKAYGRYDRATGELPDLPVGSKRGRE